MLKRPATLQVLRKHKRNNKRLLTKQRQLLHKHRLMRKLKQPQKQLPQTGSQESLLVLLGYTALAGLGLGYAKKRRRG
ncbi:TPA: LPXTG cell wall anchor domain-containing protein [Streptococcus suis]|uniref:LPXTG cell wall anchor domain-containing protein n=1 Tax=Streptococcus suis TaxID=1307 RepID=UPI00114768A0|nr:LPXTG cell wall anchor domain-containing protein [Streptococcus suis]MCK4004480.1 LPXTG cell wall anchor domain-containing protein [Streptococcus suis]NQK51788.1 LPXTG cell wall anchor domain-containing protein [Streptococcus suis]TQE83942.1 LPXTG cell wall anchor domain-containing protein [Streptococcus suis]HEL1734436.1 LPXTG cell wall anchor domain-containing protein [Streptococcus suis]